MNILVTGANSQLAKCMKDFYSLNRGILTDNYIFCSHSELDITNKVSIESCIIKHNPKVIVNCAAYTDVEKAEDEFLQCNKVNCIGVQYLLESCQRNDIFLIHISTDYVYKLPETLLPIDFMTWRQVPCSLFACKETDPLEPLSKYALSKYLGEKICLASKNCIIIRTSWLYSQYGKNFVKTITNRIDQGQPLNVVCDQVGRPTNANDLAEFIICAIISNRNFNYNQDCIVYNFQNSGYPCSWYDFSEEIAEQWTKNDFKDLLDLKEKILDYSITPVRSSEFKTKAKRPHFSMMDITQAEKLMKIPDWKKSLKLFFKEKYKRES